MFAALKESIYGRRNGMSSPMLAWPLALLIVVAVNLAAPFFALGLHINNAPEAYYPVDSPAVVLRNELRREFPGDEVLTVVFEGQDLYSMDFLRRLDSLSQALRRDPLVDRVTSITSMERISGSSDGFSVAPLVDLRRGQTPQALRQRVMDDRFAPGLLASRDGTLLAMVVRPKAFTESSERLALKVAVATAINEAGLRRYYAGDAGPVTMDVAQLESVLQDSKAFVPLTIAIGLALLGWVVGRWRPVAVGAVSLSTVVLPVIAGIALAGQPYTMASAILPSLLSAFTLATLLHLYAAVQRAQVTGMSPAQCVDRALAETRRPCAFNVLTTGAGLLSLVLVPIPPIQVFGVAGASGTLLIFLVVFFLVPPLLVRFDSKAWPQRGSGMNRLGKVACRLSLTSMRYPRTVVLVAGVVLLASVPLALKVTAESDVLAFFSADHPINRHSRLIESKLAGVTSLEISLVGNGRDSLQSVSTMSAVRDFQRWLETVPGIDRTVSMVDLVEEMHWAMNGERPSFRGLPGSDRLLKQYLLVYDGTDLYELVNRDFQHARILVNLRAHGASEIGATIDTIRQRLQTHPLAGVKVDVGGFGRLFADQVDLLVTGQANSFAGAFAQIFLFMALLWRSFTAASLCLVPNLAPLFFIFVLMGSAGIHLDLATVMIAGVVLGITVDDTIHLYHGYRQRTMAGISPVLSIARSFQSSGRAVLAISVVLVAQFALLATSDFIPTSHFGLLTSVGLVAGQVAELLLLPALLVLKDTRRGARRARSPGTASQPAGGDDTAWAPTLLHERPLLPATGGTNTGGPRAATRQDDPAYPRARTVLVCQGKACKAKGAEKVWQHWLKQESTAGTGRTRAGSILVRSSCLGSCDRAPAVCIAEGGRLFSGEGQPLLQERAEVKLTSTMSG